MELSKHHPVEYATWLSMKQRCRKDPNYAGRGISVCSRWLSFPNFLADMGKRPKEGFSIDRINNDGNYEPGNCRWATSTEQMNNTRRSLTVRYAKADERRAKILETLPRIKKPMRKRNTEHSALPKYVVKEYGLKETLSDRWMVKGFPRFWIRVFVIQGRLMLHEGAWVLAWDGEEFPISDSLAADIKTEQQLRASLRGKPKAS